MAAIDTLENSGRCTKKKIPHHVQPLGYWLSKVCFTGYRWAVKSFKVLLDNYPGLCYEASLRALTACAEFSAHSKS